MRPLKAALNSGLVSVMSLGEPSAVVLKEPAPPQGSIRSHLAKAWEHLESSLFVLHIRAARWGAITDANTQPFVRSWGRRDWMLGHSGSLLDYVKEATDSLNRKLDPADRILVVSTRYDRSRGEADVPAVTGYPPAGQILGVLMNAIFLDLLDQDAQPVSLPEEGLIISDMLAKLLDVHPGEMVTIEVLDATGELALGLFPVTPAPPVPPYPPATPALLSRKVKTG